jgi:hypothetical protein
MSSIISETAASCSTCCGTSPLNTFSRKQDQRGAPFAPRSLFSRLT